MRKQAGLVMILTLAMTLANCATARLPLCPKLAALSYQNPKPDTVVSRYLSERAKERHVKISVLSPFAAVLSGSVGSIAWFQRNYPLMLCEFDPSQLVNDENVYLSCMSHAQEWMKILQSNQPEDLMVNETHYAASCVQ